jgi:hypothetical protein
LGALGQRTERRIASGYDGIKPDMKFCDRPGKALAGQLGQRHVERYLLVLHRVYPNRRVVQVTSPPTSRSAAEVFGDKQRCIEDSIGIAETMPFFEA